MREAVIKIKLERYTCSWCQGWTLTYFSRNANCSEFKSANVFGIFFHTSGDKKMNVGLQVLTVCEEGLDEVVTFV